ncbi:phage antirepressor KilAC domain-containing protein [Acinetobacter sp. YH12108]|uniref:phage antirepressor KilAC domain-containing protein n=1 Tax=Acinetobacter sp. YH12108 TaxID=2601095 RepID=UPI0015D45F7A|nr:phage antirepressor KilAC domain-containing protein [Acinetobacter sp. YH12108]
MNMPILPQFGNSEQKMLSKDLLDLINQVRAQFNEKPVRLNDFNNRVADELDGDNYESFVVQNFNNTESVVFELTIDQCILIGMRESKGVRKNVLAILKEKQKPFDITNPAHLLQAIEIQAKQNIALKQELEIQAPKVAFVDKYVAGNGNKTFRQVAKLLGANERKFRDFLKKEKIMYKLNGEWLAYQNHIDAKRFHNNTGISESNHTFTRSLFTPKGVEWTAGEWAKFNLRGVV